MKYNNVIKKLGVFGFVVDEKGAHIFYSRDEKLANREVKVINQNGTAIALPCFVSNHASPQVVFHAKTIKSLIAFLKGA